MIDPRSLSAARLQCHWAAQLAATVGRTLATPREDDSHTSFRFDAARDALVQESPHRSGLRLRDLTLLLGDDELPLDGRTLDEAFAWIAERAPGVRRQFNEPMPHHSVADGAPFDASDRERFEELARYYREAAALLAEVHDDVRCWPHHFDIATLLTFADHTVGAGLSPGDEAIAEPYWYVNRWPAPPTPPPGDWITEGWFGAALRASEGRDAREFLRTRIAALR